MIDNLVSAWLRLPVWGRWLTGVATVFAVSSIGPAIRERDILAFIENFLALTFHYGIVIAGFVCSIWGGLKVAERSERNWLGWLAGLLIFIAFAMVLGTFQRLPGIGWRMEAMGNSDCYIDWDGRSNPTVCD
ncbi:hypothetical protein [Ensifer sp. ENS03]|uniref:hypothetical protein n=1 Tax=Ensifer sp. ENS03 TaxID=2769283 RepID=UPI00177EB97C|nr:hypothetical protein [Ensifer sp. ENS03]MBD9558444.1 hypothetical protein [Ensifer sp. ENS03]